MVPSVTLSPSCGILMFSIAKRDSSFIECIFYFSLSRLQRPDSSVISQSSGAAEKMPLRQPVLCPSNLHERLRFPLSRLQRPDSSVISQSSCAAEKMPLRQPVLCPSNLHGRLRFPFLKFR